MTLPIYVFGPQTLETFLLAALEGCDTGREIVIHSHKTVQSNILRSREDATYILIDVDEEVKKLAEFEEKFEVDDISHVLETYDGKSDLIPDLIKFVLSNKLAMRKWFTKTYGSPSSLRSFISLLNKILYDGADMDLILHAVDAHDLSSLGLDWIDRLDDDGYFIIDEVSPSKKVFDEICTRLSFDRDSVRGAKLYKNSSVEFKYEVPE